MIPNDWFHTRIKNTAISYAVYVCEITSVYCVWRRNHLWPSCIKSLSAAKRQMNNRSTFYFILSIKHIEWGTNLLQNTRNGLSFDWTWLCLFQIYYYYIYIQLKTSDISQIMFNRALFPIIWSIIVGIKAIFLFIKLHFKVNIISPLKYIYF